MKDTPGIFIRKAICALLPRSAWLKRVIYDGVVVYGQNKPGYGGRGIFIWGEDLEPELKNLHHFLGTGGVLIDVGANTGVFSLKGAKCVGSTGIVISVEPLLEMTYSLNRSVACNRFSQVRIRNFCVNRQTGPVDFWLNFNRPHSASMQCRDQSADKRSVIGVALDELVRWEHLPGLDYLKIDAEGSENDVIAGAQKTIEQYQPIIQVEHTLGTTIVPSGYQVWQHRDSPNSLMIPQNHKCLASLNGLGYAKINH